MVIFNKKLSKLASNVHNSNIFTMDPVNRCTRSPLARLAAKHLNSVAVNINIGTAT